MGRERLAHHHHEGCGRIQLSQHSLDVGAVHVAHKVGPRAAVELAQCFTCHGRTEVRSANPNVHHIGHPTLGVGIVNPVHEVQHSAAHFKHPRHDILPIDLVSVRSLPAEGHVHHCAPLGVVDRRAAKLVGNRLRHPGFLRQLEQSVHHFAVPALLGRIHIQPWQCPGQRLKPGGILAQCNSNVEGSLGLAELLQVALRAGLVQTERPPI